MSLTHLSTSLHERLAALETWLVSDDAAACRNQCHLDADSVPRAYWHLGYHAALLDLSATIAESMSGQRIERTANLSPATVQDVTSCLSV